jgi:hypothetical protein
MELYLSENKWSLKMKNEGKQTNDIFAVAKNTHTLQLDFLRKGRERNLMKYATRHRAKIKN